MSDVLAVPASRHRRWLMAATFAVALVLLAFLIVALVTFAKEQFSWLVGSAFLGSVVGMVVVGALILMVAVWNLPQRFTWGGWVLLVWALIAITSPLFGIMFLLPWGVLVLAAPLVCWVLISWFRATPR